MIRLITLLLLLNQTSIGQVKVGSYKLYSDTVATFHISSDTIIQYYSARLVIEKNQTFSCFIQSSSGCKSWYTIKGNWHTDSNKLVLFDSAIAINSEKRITRLSRITIYRIEKENLFFVEQYFTEANSSFVALTRLWGNFHYIKS